jgi:general secretion pathway protein B
MSYLLDALRKSEQQRQATQPAAATERLLVNSSQTKDKPNKWLKTILIVNLFFVLGLAAYLGYKLRLENKVAANVKHEPDISNTVKHPLTSQPSIIHDGHQQTGQTQPVLPPISELIESKKSAENFRHQIPAIQKETLEKKASNTKKKTPPQQNQNKLAQKSILPDVKRDLSVVTEQLPVNVKELSNQQRHGLPDMKINVFSYAQKPEDRFVIIDMVKYKPGQFIKGSAKLKAILEDSIIVEDDGKTFKVERP